MPWHTFLVVTDAKLCEVLCSVYVAEFSVSVILKIINDSFNYNSNNIALQLLDY